MIRIVGAGAWGTALAVLWSHGKGSDAASEPIELVARSTADADAIRLVHRNERRLRGIDLPQSIAIRSLDETLAEAGVEDLVIVAVPTDSVEATLRRIEIGRAHV